MYQPPNDPNRPPPPPNYPYASQQGFRPSALPQRPKKKSNTRLLVVIGVSMLTLSLCGLCGIISQTPSSKTIAAQTIPTATATRTDGATNSADSATPTQAQPTTAPTPTALPTDPPKPTQPPVQPTRPPAPPPPPPGPTYNFDPNGGQVVNDPPGDWCSSHACVTTFWKDTSGYVVQCGDGKYSHSGGITGACSRNGGVAATLYRH